MEGWSHVKRRPDSPIGNRILAYGGIHDTQSSHKSSHQSSQLSIAIYIFKQSGAELEHWFIAADVRDAIRQARAFDEELARELECRNSGAWFNAPSEGKHELRGGYTMVVRFIRNF